MRSADAYRAFLEAKRPSPGSLGFDCDESEVSPIARPHQKACIVWAVRGGRRALFEAFGLGKSLQQLEVLRLILKKIGGQDRALIIAPLGVRQEFRRDAEMLGLSIEFVRRTEEVGGPGLYITNYESVRDGRLDPRLFAAVSLDEASCLRGLGGTKTFREFMRLFEHSSIRYRFVATATPAPNEYIELLAYAAFLEVMDVGQAKTRFFKRDSEKADSLTLHPHKEEEFWLWVNSWAIFLQRPSDLGFDDTGYDLPPLDIRWHEIRTDHAGAGRERDGQHRLFKNAAVGVVDAAREKRDSLSLRISKLLELRAEDPAAHRVIWHDLEAEREAIEASVAGVVSVYGAQDLDERENAIIRFSEGLIPELAAKPVLAGSGCNFQRFCSWAIYLGIGFKFNDFIQSIHRLQRYLQTKTVRIDLIYTEAEREVRRVLEAKWKRHEELVGKMTDIIRRYNLNQSQMAEALTRAIGVKERIEVTGRSFRAIHNDCVDELRRMPDDSVHLGLTSIPFSTQYEYSPNYADFGHSDDDAHFWEQMSFLTPEFIRVLKPGRIAAIHVKDRITPGGINGLGFQTLSGFSDDCKKHFQNPGMLRCERCNQRQTGGRFCSNCAGPLPERTCLRCRRALPSLPIDQEFGGFCTSCGAPQGLAFLGRITIVTDVVRENNQTYRLGWTEQCKDGSRMGVGVPEYLLLFRKPPNDRSNGYADEPVVKEKKVWEREASAWLNETGYSRGRWQLDAHGFHRSSGERLLAPEEIVGLPPDVVYKVWKRYNLQSVYDFEHHVRIGEALEARSSLPPTFMLIPPHSWHPEVWADVARMVTLNAQQVAKGREMHLCPLQFDIVDRTINRFSMEGETVLDWFGGIMTVPYRAIKLRRFGIGIELSHRYFLDGVAHCRAAEEKMAMPSLFDYLNEPGDENAA